jgi:hypothetical protein
MEYFSAAPEIVVTRWCDARALRPPIRYPLCGPGASERGAIAQCGGAGNTETR